MHQAVHAAKINKRAEVDDRGHDATPDLTLLQLGRKFWRTSDWVCSSQARRDSTTLRFLSSSMILASSSMPTYG